MDAFKPSPVAARLWRLLDERPGPWELAELLRDLKCSKTALLKAVYELEEVGILASWTEGNDDEV